MLMNSSSWPAGRRFKLNRVRMKAKTETRAKADNKVINFDPVGIRDYLVLSVNWPMRATGVLIK